MNTTCKVPNCPVCGGKGRRCNIRVKFLGEWSIYMRCKSKRQAQRMLKLCKAGCSWPLRIVEA